jgi:H+-transporting ATPase
VEISRPIYQRMLTYTINKIMKTLGWRSASIVLLLFTNDFVKMSIATGHIPLSQRPDRWNVRTLILTGSFLALV